MQLCAYIVLDIEKDIPFISKKCAGQELWGGLPTTILKPSAIDFFIVSETSRLL